MSIVRLLYPSLRPTDQTIILSIYLSQGLSHDMRYRRLYFGSPIFRWTSLV